MTPTLIALLLACRSDPSGGGTLPDDTGAPSALAQDACGSLAGGAASTEDPRLALSRLHATVRFFRPSKQWVEADQALVEAVGGETWDAQGALSTYGPAVGGCVVPATEATLGSASVELVGEVAIVHPGQGAIVLPDEAAAVALDLRDLPAGAETEQALQGALEAVLMGEVALSGAEVRVFTGLPGPEGIGSAYTSEKEEFEWTVVGAATASRPLAVLTETAMPPEAARVAGALRLAGQAWLVGHPIWAAAAESSWTPVGTSGLAVPTRTLRAADEDWPDLVPVDVQTDDPEAAIADLSTWGTPADLPAGEVTRPTLERWTGDADEPLTTLDRGAARAMLLVAHGVVDRFFPYFEVVGRNHDQALLTGLDEVDSLPEGDREGVRVALGRFMHSLEDGHGFFYDWAGDEAPDSYLPLQVERIDGAAVIRTSGDAAVQAGDTIVQIDGVDATDWYADHMAWHSAATTGYLFEVAGREWKNLVDAAVTLTVRGMDGTERTVQVEGVSYEERAALVPWGGTLRASGWLPDLGAPTVYLLNLNGEVTTEDAQWDAAIDEAAGATGLVIDMRDYPVINQYSLVAAFHEGSFTSATFRIPTWTGPDSLGSTDSSYTFQGDGRFLGPIVLLVSNKTVSAAENLSQMLWARDNVTVIGQPSAGTNGNITAAWLPGGYLIYLTGMEVRNPDGSTLHGVGIPLDVEVLPTPEDYAAGIDPELVAALDWLGTVAGGATAAAAPWPR